MIPLKEEPTVNATLCFSQEDADALLSCQSHLALAGNVVIASARHENLLAHYTRTLLAGLNSGRANAVAIRRMPKSSDALLERFNEHLANLDISALQTKRVVKTREVWLYELPGPAETELLQMAGKMIRQFKASGVSLMVHSRQARPDSPHLQKLAGRMQAKHVAFQTPTEDQCRELAEKARGCPEAGQINQLIRSLGVALETETPAELAEISSPADLAELMQQAEKNLPREPSAPIQPQQQSQRLQAPVSAQRKTPTADPVKHPASGVSNTRILISSGVASLLVIGLYLSPGSDVFSLLDKGMVWAQSLAAPTQVATTEAPEQAQPDATSGQPTVPTVAQTTPEQAPALTAPEEQILAPATDSSKVEPKAESMAVAAMPLPTAVAPVVMDEEAGLKALFPVTSPAQPQQQAAQPPAPARPDVEPGVYVQHASFRLPQSALIWKNNNAQIPGVKVFAKGERFVTVSGPFLDRGEATNYLAEFGVTATPYFITSDVLAVRS